MHVNHERLLAKLAKRVAVGKSLNRQAIAKAKRNETLSEGHRLLDAKRTGQSARNHAESEAYVWQQLRSTRQHFLGGSDVKRRTVSRRPQVSQWVTETGNMVSNRQMIGA